MTQGNNSTAGPVNKTALIKRMAIGGGIALVLISLLVLPVEGKPEWSAFWKVRPLVVTTLAGATGGAFFYFITSRFPEGWKSIAAIILSVLIYIVGIWMGSVLGMAGTLWN